MSIMLICFTLSATSYLRFRINGFVIAPHQRILFKWALFFAHTKYGAGKYQEATLLLNLKNKRVLFGRLRFPAKELVRVVESVADYLNDLDWLAIIVPGALIICSVRCKTGTRLSTFEISIKCIGVNAYETRLIQHKGIGNAAPPTKSQESLRYFMRFLKEAEGKECLRQFSREKLLFNLDAKLAKDHLMANRIRKFLNDMGGSRI
jgi:hypothetical protein